MNIRTVPDISIYSQEMKNPMETSPVEMQAMTAPTWSKVFLPILCSTNETMKLVRMGRKLMMIGKIDTKSGVTSPMSSLLQATTALIPLNLCSKAMKRARNLANLGVAKIYFYSYSVSSTTSCYPSISVQFSYLF